MSYYSPCELCPPSSLQAITELAIILISQMRKPHAQRTLRNVSTAHGTKDQTPGPSEPDLGSEAPAVFFWGSPEPKCPVTPFSQHWNSKTASSGNPTGTNQAQARPTAY